MRRVNEKMVEVYGPCPPNPEPPLKLRVGLWGLRKKLSGLEPVEVSMFWKKLIVSLGAGVAAGAAAIQPALADQVVTGNEWGAVITAGVIAAYGAFKSNTTWFAPARKGESITKFGPGEGDFVRPPR